MKEVARLRLVSRRWEFIWRCCPHLIFENLRAMGNIWRNWKVIGEKRHEFVRMVDRVLEEHLGAAIDELRITFDLDQNWQSYVDKWVVFAVDKRVKRLEFNFSSFWLHVYRSSNSIVSPICEEPLNLPPNFTGFKSFLTSLCLKYVNVTDEFIDYISHSCPFLENLCIVGSKCLTRIFGAFDQVKHLEVSFCCNMKTIDISARTLCSFTMCSQHMKQLRMAHASSLAEVSIGGYENLYAVTYAIDSLAVYLSQVSYLCLTIAKNMIRGIDNPAAMPKLQYLELQVSAYWNRSLRGWTPLIVASPRLQKLTLKLNCHRTKFDRPVVKWPGSPLKCLKTLEIVGYVGRSIDLGLALFVLENASMLEEVIVNFVPRYHKKDEIDARERLVKLQDKIPQGVKLTVN